MQATGPLSLPLDIVLTEFFLQNSCWYSNTESLEYDCF